MIESGTRLASLSSPPIDEPFALNAEYVEDTSPSKVNLGIGVYRSENGHPWPLTVVEQVEELLRDQQDAARHEYLTIQGDKNFLNLARDLAFDLEPSSEVDMVERSRIVSVQTVSGTGANHLGAKYVSTLLSKPPRVWLPTPTWGNHPTIWDLVNAEVCTYQHYDDSQNTVDVVSIMNVLEEQALPGDVVLFHACAHNPTGSDPSKEQWNAIIEACCKRGVIPFLDLAYQGFASGNVSEDAWAVKAFLRQPGLEFCVAQSFSKNFGLYGQRVGALHIVLNNSSIGLHEHVLSNLCHLIRGEFSMAPRAGSDIVRTALGNSKLRKQWERDLLKMSGRLKTMRQLLYHELVRLQTPGSWKHITDQVGMFSYTGLSEPQVLAVRKRYHIYMLRSGRMSMSGVTTKNVIFIARAFDDVIRSVRE